MNPTFKILDQNSRIIGEFQKGICSLRHRLLEDCLEFIDWTLEEGTLEPLESIPKDFLIEYERQDDTVSLKFCVIQTIDDVEPVWENLLSSGKSIKVQKLQGQAQGLLYTEKVKTKSRFQEALESIIGKTPPFFLEEVCGHQDIDPEYLEEIEQWCSQNARPSWASGRSILEAATLLAQSPGKTDSLS